jgi:hypothetical protein
MLPLETRGSRSVTMYRSGCCPAKNSNGKGTVIFAKKTLVRITDELIIDLFKEFNGFFSLTLNLIAA